MTNDELKALLLKHKDICPLDCGFWHYWPEKNRGALSSHNLKQVAEILDEINAPWQKQLEQYFAENPRHDGEADVGF